MVSCRILNLVGAFEKLTLEICFNKKKPGKLKKNSRDE